LATLIVLYSLASAPAWAQEDEAEAESEVIEDEAQDEVVEQEAVPTKTPTEAATQAQAIHTKHCADMAADDTSLAAHTLQTVGAAWQEVSEAHKAQPEPYLLYWRGVLAACLGQDGRAQVDLMGFVDEYSGNNAYAAMVRDARRRLRRVNLSTTASAGVRASGSPSPNGTGALPAGVALAGGALGSGIVAAILWSQAVAIGDELNDRPHQAAELSSLRENGDAMAVTSGVLTGVAVGCGVASAVALLVGAQNKARGTAAGRWAPGRNRGVSSSATPWIGGDGHGLFGGIGGRW